jgi:hypothetical protein
MEILNLNDESNPTARRTVEHIDQMNSVRIKVSERLRKWIDQWLDYERTAGGVACPTRRNYGDAKLVSTAVYNDSTRGEMHLLVTRNGLEVWFDLRNGKTPEGEAETSQATETIMPLDCRLHDLRHTAVSRMLNAEVPIAGIVGWSPATMVRMAARYGHFSLNRLRGAVESISWTGTELGSSVKSPDFTPKKESQSL